MKLAATIIGKATDDIIDKGRKIASFLPETGEIDIEFERGRYRVADTDREVGIFDVATAALTRKDLPEDLQAPLAGISDQTLRVASFPYGTQVCEVEVDPETGEVEILGYAAVDDVGRAINPLILHGQTHGGIAQGVGQALLESSYYEPRSGQLLAASFTDYAMPRADTLPFLATAPSEVPTPTNRLGVRSGGEGGTPALAAVINAIVDALAQLGVRHIEMPATPEQVWHAMRAAAARLPPRICSPRVSSSTGRTFTLRLLSRWERLASRTRCLNACISSRLVKRSSGAREDHWRLACISSVISLTPSGQEGRGCPLLSTSRYLRARRDKPPQPLLKGRGGLFVFGEFRGDLEQRAARWREADRDFQTGLTICPGSRPAQPGSP